MECLCASTWRRSHGQFKRKEVVTNLSSTRVYAWELIKNVQNKCSFSRLPWTRIFDSVTIFDQNHGKSSRKKKKQLFQQNVFMTNCPPWSVYMSLNIWRIHPTLLLITDQPVAYEGLLFGPFLCRQARETTVRQGPSLTLRHEIMDAFQKKEVWIRLRVFTLC